MLLDAEESSEDRTTMSPATIFQLMELCLRTTYFEFREEFYEQVDGAAMGSPLSPVIANIYMEGFEEEALNKAAENHHSGCAMCMTHLSFGHTDWTNLRTSTAT